jgi:bacterioferritin-associated ferredoxin
MFVCICRAVTMNRLLATVDSGARTLEAVEASCGAGSDCGSCRREIAELIHQRPSVGRPDSEAA